MAVADATLDPALFSAGRHKLLTDKIKKKHQKAPKHAVVAVAAAKEHAVEHDLQEYVNDRARRPSAAARQHPRASGSLLACHSTPWGLAAGLPARNDARRAHVHNHP